VGQEVTVARLFSPDRSFSYLAAANLDGMLLGACQLLNTAKCGVDRGRFLAWVERCLAPQLGSYAMREKNSIVVIDNARIHHCVEFMDMVERTGAKVIFLPPYSPDYNPIELCFAQIKRFCRARSLDAGWSQKQPDAVAWEAAACITAANMQGYARKCFLPAPVEGWLAGADEGSSAATAAGGSLLAEVPLAASVAGAVAANPLLTRGLIDLARS
jgi:hypothetical protein